MAYIGKKIKVGLGSETTRGVRASEIYGLPVVSVDFDDKVETVLNEAGIGNITETHESYLAKVWGEGSIETYLTMNAVGYFLKSIFGSVNSEETTGGGAYVHTFSLANDNVHPSLTVFMEEPAKKTYYALAMVDEITIKAEPGKLVEISVDIKSKKGEVDNTITITYEEDYEFLSRLMNVFLADDLGGLNTASAIDLLNFEIKISQDLEEKFVLGSDTVEDYFNKIWSIEGGFEMIYENDTYKNIVVDGDKKAMKVVLVDTNKTIGASDNPRFELILPKVGFTEYGRKLDNNDIVTQSVGFKGLYSINDGFMANAVLVNTKTSY